MLVERLFAPPTESLGTRLVERQFALILPLLCSLSILRLQYFARGSQSYHAQLQAALKGKSVLDMKDEQVSGS